MNDTTTKTMTDPMRDPKTILKTDPMTNWPWGNSPHIKTKTMIFIMIHEPKVSHKLLLRASFALFDVFQGSHRHKISGPINQCLAAQTNKAGGDFSQWLQPKSAWSEDWTETLSPNLPAVDQLLLLMLLLLLLQNRETLAHCCTKSLCYWGAEIKTEFLMTIKK